MYHRPTTGRLVAAILLGLIFGGILGESMGFLFGWLGELTSAGWDNPLRTLFIESWELNLGYGPNSGLDLDLNLFKIQFGFAFRFNLISLVGVFLALYIEKWSRNN